jgi:hypothetical protein
VDRGNHTLLSCFFRLFVNWLLSTLTYKKVVDGTVNICQNSHMAGAFTKRCRTCKKEAHRKYFDGTPRPAPGELPICGTCWNAAILDAKAHPKARDIEWKI